MEDLFPMNSNSTSQGYTFTRVSLLVNKLNTIHAHRFNKGTNSFTILMDRFRGSTRGGLCGVCDGSGVILSTLKAPLTSVSYNRL